MAETTTTTVVPPKFLPPVRNIDFGRGTTDRIGGFKVVGDVPGGARSGGGGSSGGAGTGATPIVQEVVVTSGTGVQVEGQTFHGGAEVPGTGMTASQLQVLATAQARQQGITGRSQVTYPLSQTEQPQQGTTRFVTASGEQRTFPTPTRTNEELRFEIEQKVRERSQAETNFPETTKFLTGEEFGRGVGVGIKIPGLDKQPLFISGKEIVESGIVEKVGGATGGASSIRTTDIFTGDLNQEIKFGIERGRFGGRVATEFVPTTVGESLIVGGTISTAFLAPPVVTSTLSLGFGALGTKQLFDPSLTTEQRAAGAFVGVGGIVGAGFSAVPFVRGLKTRVTGSKVVTAEQGFQFIKTGDLDIGLIKPGSPVVDVSLPRTSPLRRGGFGVSSSEKALFLGKKQVLATSQIDFFKIGKDIPIERPFFTTPQEPTLKIAETRVSRLGLTDILKLPRDTQIGFGLPGKPQIGILKEGTVLRAETPKGFKIGVGSELEAVKSAGTIQEVVKIGETTIKGQAVDIFEFKIGRGGKGGKGKTTGETTVGTTKISGETIITGAGTSGIVPSGTTPTGGRSGGSGRSGGTGGRGGGSSPPSPLPTIIIPPIIPPTIPPPTFRTPPITPPFTPPKIPKTPLIIPPTTIGGRFKFTTRNLPKTTFGKFPVLVRRFGKFKLAGVGRTPREAIGIGKDVVGKTLARTFKVPGVKPSKITGFRTKKEKEGLVFIEPSKRALSTRTEQKEILGFKAKAPRKVKGRRK